MYLAGLLANWLLKPPCLVLDMSDLGVPIGTPTNLRITRARARPTFSCLLIINCPKLLFTQDAAAWFSVGPVVEFARWVGLGGLDWVMALVVFLGLLHLAVEVTSSLRRN